MSILQMVKVWEHEFPHPEQAVMLALADHAHDDGEGIRPALDRIAWKTGYARRNVQLILKRLKASGVVVETKPATHNEPAHLKFDWSKAQPKQSYEAYKAGKEQKLEQGCKDYTPHEDGGANQGCKDYTPEKEAIEGCKDYTPDSALGVINGSPQGCNGDHPRGDQEIISGVIDGSPDPSFKPSIEPSIEPKTPLAPQGGTLSAPAVQKVIPIEQAEQPEDCSSKPDSPKPHHDNPVGELKGSGEGKSSEARSRNRNRRSKAGRAERIYRQLEGDPRYEAGKFYQWFDWYKRKLCEPYGKAHGDKAGAAASWMNLVESGVNLQQVSAGSSQYLGWVRCNPDHRACEIPHAHNFLEGKRSHPTPYWQLALEDATAAPVTGAEFVAEPAPAMTWQEWSRRLGALLRETGYLLPDASGDCPSTRYVTSASELSADELPALVTWLESLSARRSA
ncbi:hypothetical protein [Halomicronema sp. CCY15110]|uniref:hypothetical protein n=1 Tax=Halomicronema sp. CCY15110 TaxID=2767773 RepID=UPI00194F9FB4|nr:hypothetical protein [Halomicronema sp. CCY15110]